MLVVNCASCLYYCCLFPVLHLLLCLSISSCCFSFYFAFMVWFDIITHFTMKHCNQTLSNQQHSKVTATATATVTVTVSVTVTVTVAERTYQIIGRITTINWNTKRPNKSKNTTQEKRKVQIIQLHDSTQTQQPIQLKTTENTITDREELYKERNTHTQHIRERKTRTTLIQE